MRFGEEVSTEQTETGTLKETRKWRDGQVMVIVREYRERVQVMLATDLDSIIEEMRVKHALDQAFGAWLERGDKDKLYVVKYYVTSEKPTIQR